MDKFLYMAIKVRKQVHVYRLFVHMNADVPVFVASTGNASTRHHNDVYEQEACSSKPYKMQSVTIG